MITKPHSTPSFFSNLSDMLNQSHPLYKLADKIDWAKFDAAFSPLYCPNNGRPAKPIRLMCGLLILKHLRNLSDESVVEQWSENAYYQYFCGMKEFIPNAPCASSELVHFRNHRLKLPLRQSYTFVFKGIYRDQRFRNHPKNRQKAVRADKKLRTIAGRLVRELKRNLGAHSEYTELIERFEMILAQRRHSGKKIYSIHEPEVQCINKGKEHKKYEFGNKVSIIRSATGIILGAQSFRNEYDGHTIEASLAQVERLTQRKIKILAGDRAIGGRKRLMALRF